MIITKSMFIQDLQYFGALCGLGACVPDHHRPLIDDLHEWRWGHTIRCMLLWNQPSLDHPMNKNEPNISNSSKKQYLKYT